MDLLPSRPSAQGGWASTNWSVVRDLSIAEPEPRERAWTELVEAYQGPMEAFVRSLLRRVRPSAPSDLPADIVQGFLAGCLEKGWLERADAERGSFRAFVRKILQRVVFKYVRREEAQKRKPAHGGAVQVLDEAAAGARGAHALDAELEAFDRAWVQAALERAMEALRAENVRYYDVIADLVAGGGEPSADLAERLGVPRQQLPVLRHRARAKFVGLFESEVRATVRDQDAFEEEWASLAPYLP